MKKILKKIKKHFQEVLKIKSSPKSIAIGGAIGTFLGIAPTFGIEAIFIILIILIFKKISKVSLLIAYAFWNPFVTSPLYLLGYKIGDLILMNSPTKIYEIELFNQIIFYAKRTLIGTSLIALIVSLASYPIFYKITKKYQENKKKK